MAIQLIYDKSCPACDHYASLVTIRKDLGELELINAREHPQLLAELQQQGINIDNQMLLRLDDQQYAGSDALHMLALLSSQSGMFNRLNHWLFRSEYRARLSYPILAGGRRILLRLLRRELL